MKVVYRIGLAVVALVVALFTVLYLSLNSLIQKGAEVIAPKMTGTRVVVEKVAVSPLSGRGQIRGLVIGNPEGFRTEQAFKLSEIRVNLEMKSLLSDRVRIQEVYIDQPEITLERSRGGSNIGQIRKNVERFGASRTKAQQAILNPEEPQRRYQIDHLILKNARVKLSAGFMKGRTAEVTLRVIHLRDIGKGGQGATLEEVFSKALAALTAEVSRAVSTSGNLVEMPVDSMGQSAKDIGDRATESLSETMKGVKRLFGK